MVEYIRHTKREINGEYVGMKWPFQVSMQIDYHSNGGYLKLHMNVDELGHTIGREEFAEKFTAETQEKIFKALDNFAERVAQISGSGEDVSFPGAQTENGAVEFKHRLKDALHSEVYELMAIM